MAIRETLTLDLSQALSQLDDLERSLDSLIQPIVIPVEVETDQALEKLKRDIKEADADDIDIDVDVEGVERAEAEFEDLRREVDKTDDGLEKVERQAKKTGDDLERAGKKGKSSFSGLTKGVLAFGAALGGIAALRGLLTFFGDAIDAASDLEESTSKAQVVFGSFFDDIQEFSQTAPQALGLANAVALEFTGTFGNLFVALGLSQQAAADLAPEIVQLGADLASFNNIEVTEALDKLRAGLVGEAEPLRVLGVNLTAATVEAKAAEAGLLGLNGELTEAAKVQARYLLIVEQTATAQGDFARTSDGLANQQRTLAGEFENFRAAVGEALIPAFQAILDLAPDVVDAIEAGLVPAIASLSAAIASVDTAALATNLAQLPQIVGGTVSVFDSLAQGLVNVAQALGAVARFDRGDFLAQSTQGIEDFNNILASLTAGRAVNNLIVALGAGVEPAAALESVLVELGKSVSNLDLAQFQGLIDQLLSISDLDDFEISGLIRDIRATGIAAGFSEAGINLLVQSLLDARSVTPRLRNEMDEVVRVLKEAGAAGAEAAPGIDDFTDAMEDLRQANVDDIIAELETQFDALPDALNAAAAALRDSEGDIVEDFTMFLDNLEAELEARAAFATNVLILRALGLEELAAVFSRAGLDAAAALADAVANPEEAREAERKLVGFAEDQADAFSRAFLSKLQELGLAGMFTIPASVIVTLDTVVITPPDLTGDAIAITPPNLTGPRAGDVTVIFEGADVPTADTERAVQTIRSLVR